eukprot:1154202-Pelagomonas_calceolata.AAC.4
MSRAFALACHNRKSAASLQPWHLGHAGVVVTTRSAEANASRSISAKLPPPGAAIVSASAAPAVA